MTLTFFFLFSQSTSFGIVLFAANELASRIHFALQASLQNGTIHGGGGGNMMMMQQQQQQQQQGMGNMGMVQVVPVNNNMDISSWGKEPGGPY